MAVAKEDAEGRLTVTGFDEDYLRARAVWPSTKEMWNAAGIPKDIQKILRNANSKYLYLNDEVEQEVTEYYGIPYSNCLSE